MTLSGIEIAERDDRVRPADDLYRHINGKWLERTVIPADRARYGSFHRLVEAAEEAVRDIADFRFEDFEIAGYQSHPHIAAPVAV